MKLSRLAFGALAVGYVASKETPLLNNISALSGHNGPKIVQVNAAGQMPNVEDFAPCQPERPRRASSNGEPGSSILIEVD